jgi:Cof subfamily protein (haloacid dehalogenase superfamily)
MSYVAKKYILTDLDGTLLRSNSTLSAFSKDTLSAALESGHVISYATARSYLSSINIVSAIPWRYPLVLYNGALIMEPSTNQTLGGAWLPHTVAHEVIAMGKTYDYTPFLFLLDENDQEIVLHEPLRKFGERGFYDSRPNDRRFRLMPQLLLSHPRQKMLLITYIGVYKELKPFYDDLMRVFGDGIYIHFALDTYLKDQYFLEVSHPNANKYAGTLKWAELVGCSPQDITVFGDNLNDLGLFKAGGHRLAVSNARSELKEKADQIIASNDQDGVAHYIQQCIT